MREKGDNLRTISNSQIQTFMTCPRRWEFRYTKGLILPPKGIMVQGSAYHGAIKESLEYKMAKGNPLGEDDLYGAFDTYWNKSINGEYGEKDEDIARDFVDWEGQNPGKIKDEGFRVASLYNKTYVPILNPVEVEKEAVKNISDTVVLHGYIDCYTGDKVIDHKLKSRAMSESDARQNSQAFAYCYLKDTPKFEFHVCIKGERARIVPVGVLKTSEDINWWLDSVLQICRQIDTGICPPNYVGWHCSEKFCGYWDLCQKMRSKSFFF